MKLIFSALILAYSLTPLKADILKFDEEDMRNLLASDPIALFTFPPIYAFSQGIQLARENRCRYFAFVYYEGNFGGFKTVTHFKPTIGTGRLLKYEDPWIYLEIIGYVDSPPLERSVFDGDHYKIPFYEEDEGPKP